MEGDVNSIPFPVTHNYRAFITLWYNSNTKYLRIRFGEQYCNNKITYLTIRYTKK